MKIPTTGRARGAAPTSLTRTRGSSVLLAVLLAPTLFLPIQLGAQERQTRAPVMERQVEFDLAYGRGVDISSKATFLGDVRMVGLLPRLGEVVGEPRFPGTFYRGRTSALIELPLLLSFEPEEGYAVGASLLGRYTFTALEHVRPFVALGGGPVYLSFNNEANQADGLSFTLQGGAGVELAINPEWALVWRAQFHHISNAGLRRPNPGINDVLVSLGIARRFP